MLVPFSLKQKSLTSLATGTSFTEDNISTDGVCVYVCGGVSRMIQVHYISCVLYFYYNYIRHFIITLNESHKECTI